MSILHSIHRKYRGFSSWRASCTMHVFKNHSATMRCCSVVNSVGTPSISGPKMGLSSDSSWLIHSLLHRVQGALVKRPKVPRVVNTLLEWMLLFSQFCLPNLRAIHFGITSSLLGLESHLPQKIQGARLGIAVTYFRGFFLRFLSRSYSACLASSSFLGTAIKPLASLAKFSKGWLLSDSFGGGLTCFIQRPFFFLPRLGRPLSSVTRRGLARQFFAGQALACDGLDHAQEPVGVVALALVEAERLLVKVAEQVKRLHRNIRALNRTLEKRPKVFDAVRVNVAAHVLFRVVGELVNVIRAQSEVRPEGGRVDFRTGFNVTSHFTLKSFRRPVEDNLCPDLAAVAVTLKNAEHDRLAASPRPCNLRLARVLVHVAGESADERLIRFDRAAHLLKRAVLHGEAAAVPKKPSRLMRDAERAVNIVRSDDVICVSNNTHGR